MARVALRVNDGDMAGKRLGELFVFPVKEDDSRFGLQRFHAFLIALGMKEQSKAVRIDGKQFTGRTCIAEVDDEEMPATDSYPARVRSRPLAFYRIDDPEAPPVNGAVPQASAPAAPVPVVPAPAV